MQTSHSLNCQWICPSEINAFRRTTHPFSAMFSVFQPYTLRMGVVHLYQFRSFSAVCVGLPGSKLFAYSKFSLCVP